MEPFVTVEPMRSPWSRSSTEPRELKTIPITTFDYHPSGAPLWVLRGPPVGLVLGAAYGSWVPFLGTVVGGLIGAAVGLLLGLAIACEVFLLRTVILRFAVSRSRADIAEQLVASMTIVGAAVIAAWHMDGVLAVGLFYIPALLGVAHSLLAKPPVNGAIYAGTIGGTRLWFTDRAPLHHRRPCALGVSGPWILA